MASQFSPTEAAILADSKNRSDGTATIRDIAESILNLRIDSEIVNSYSVRNDADRPTVKYNDWIDLPLIDLSRLTTDRAGLCKEVGGAAREWGFFQIVNHGISVEDLQEVESQGFKFFELPADIKLKLAGGEAYVGNNRESKISSLHWAESWTVLFSPRSAIEEKISTIFPGGNPDLSGALNKFCEASEAINKELLELLAEYLGLKTDFFSQHLNDKRTSLARWNYYPACPKPSDVLGASGHTDGCSITVLLQDQIGGLQIHRDGEWLGVRPVPGALVVNIGDALHAWTNGHFKSVLHRVVLNEERHRLSLAVFLNVDNTLNISAPQELVDDEHPRLYKPFTFRDYLQLVRHSRVIASDLKILNGLFVLDGLRVEN